MPRGGSDDASRPTAQFYSGGQVDYLRGASRSRGGKPIIAISSTAKNGTISRIVPMLSPGAGVVTSLRLVRYVVTWRGLLAWQIIRERAKALIEIAHPQFRNELYKYCEQTKWLQRPHSVSADDTTLGRLAVFNGDT